ncbi:transglycosylase SLT domain-containing protein [Acinetobacter nosocomialis]|uniref:transglycosylase SLT domain-containing protein n=1 Tax=Acinetobacter nosocomialis TaxID=106654 RepID=UPI000E6AD993|nr:transglycosylase SLT domain-containing protein [Acinetobacter nosocomialis]
MASNENRVEVQVGANTAELQRGMHEGEAIVERSANNIENIGRNIDFRVDLSSMEESFDRVSTSINSRIKTLGMNIASTLAQSLAIGGLVAFAKQTIDTGNEVDKLAKLVGTSAEKFQYYSKGAEMAGLSMDQFGSMGKDALDKLGEARRGEGEMMDFFEKIGPKVGVTIDQFKDLSGPDVLQAYYNGLEKANLSHAEIVTYMEQLVDDGSALIPMLQNGGAGFKKWGEEAKAAGAIMSDSMIANLKTAKENVFKLQLQFQGLQAILVNNITPVITSISKNFDTIKTVLVVLAAVIATRLAVQLAILTKEFLIGVAQGMAYQVQLSALQGQAIRTATAMGVLRSASALLGGPAGLAMLAVQGVAAGAAFLYMKNSSDDLAPSLDTQKKSVTELRDEYEKLEASQQRVLTRKATDELQKTSTAYRNQRNELLGLVDAITRNSDVSDEDRAAASYLFEEYRKGRIVAEQLAGGINQLKTVNANAKASIDDKVFSLKEEAKKVVEADRVLKVYSNTIKQGSTDNKDHAKSVDKVTEAYANLTAKQVEYVKGVELAKEKEKYIQDLMKQGYTRERAEFYADAKEKSGTAFNAQTPKGLGDSINQAYKLKQQEDARTETEKKAAEVLKEQTKELEKHQKILQINERVKANAQKYNFAGLEKQYQLPSGTLSSIHMIESKGNPNAYNKETGATGGFQFLESTAKQYGVKNRNDLGQSAEGAAKYMSYLLKLFKGDLEKAVRAYHAGEGNVQAGKGMGKFNNAYWSDFKGYMAGTNGVSAGTESNEYEKALQEQIREAENAEKAKIQLQYKYADEEKKIAIDLKNELEAISKSTLSAEDKKAFSIKAEKEANDKILALKLELFEKTKAIREAEIDHFQRVAERTFQIEMAQVQADFDANKISHVQKVQREKFLEDTLTAIKRQGLLDRLDLENELSGISGKQGNQGQILENISGLDTGKQVSDTKLNGMISEAEMADYEAKFGGFTSRLASLWDQGIQSLMNGTLTWNNATRAVLTDLGAFVLQSATKELQGWLRIQTMKLAKKYGFITAETAAEASGQAAQTGATIAGEATRTGVTASGGLARLGLKATEAIKGIMMSAWEAMAGAFKAMVSIPYIGPVLAVGAGAAAFGLVAGLAGKIKSARGGYDIPSGVNPITQLHEDEMVLPAQHANTIRELGKSTFNSGMSDDSDITGQGGENAVLNIQAWDSRDIKRFMKKHGREVAGGLKGYRRSFGK